MHSPLNRARVVALPELQPVPIHIRPSSPEVKDFIVATKGGPVASRMLCDVHFFSEHAALVLRSTPVLFWLFHNHSAEDIAGIIEEHGSAKKVLREAFELPKAVTKIISPWPQNAVNPIRQFLRELEPAHLANTIPETRKDQWRMLSAFGSFATTGGNVGPDEWKKLHMFILANWDAVASTDDTQHTCDFMWANPDLLPKRCNAGTLQRLVTAWDIEIKKARVYGSSQPFDALKDYPEGYMIGGHCFTLIDSEIGLSEEGHDMSHCVGAYTARSRNGLSIIYHVESPIGDRATLELQPRKGEHVINQLRGPHNAKVTAPLSRASAEFLHLVNELVDRRGYETNRLL